MKLFKITALVFLTILIVSGCNSQQADSNDGKWVTNLESAIKTAKAENKFVLVNFTGSDWCKWCIKLNNEVFTQEAFQKYADEKLVLVKLDFPRTIEQSPEVKEYNNNLMRQFGVRGFPTIFLINSEGRPIAQTQYLPGGAENYIKHLDGLIKSRS